MPRRGRRFSWLGLSYAVVSTGLLLGVSLWLDRQGQSARAVVKEQHEEITMHDVPKADGIDGTASRWSSPPHTGPAWRC